ncbi:hypothetical protein ACGF13_10345 [Kitasatospora sp. NPDC048286]|uniref:hypothetical protein n=1 Tax=Kitasatospora sp. NPDC048286 TaxID=3364047 RepID=UPI003718813E
MGPVPGAREELDWLGHALRAQLVELIDELAPGSDLSLLFLAEPEVVDWHEPLRYRYSVGCFTGMRPANVTAAGGTVRIVVTGRRHGCGIEIRAVDHMSTLWFSWQTPAMALYEPEEFRRPEPLLTPETVTPGYVLCYECDGLGWCHDCGGRGWRPDAAHGRVNCPACHRRRVCVICRGAAELAVTDLSLYQRGYYPELGQ